MGHEWMTNGLTIGTQSLESWAASRFPFREANSAARASAVFFSAIFQRLRNHANCKIGVYALVYSHEY